MLQIMKQNGSFNGGACALRFPSPKAIGKISHDRIRVSTHEVGHMLTALLTGLRTEIISVEAEDESMGGFVKFMDQPFVGKGFIAHI